jgi:hypothetical protein
MIPCHAGRRPERAAELPAAPHDAAPTSPAGDASPMQPALRAMLVLSGAVSSTDPALVRISDADLAYLSAGMVLLARPESPANAA